MGRKDTTNVGWSSLFEALGVPFLFTNHVVVQCLKKQQRDQFPNWPGLTSRTYYSPWPPVIMVREIRSGVAVASRLHPKLQGPGRGLAVTTLMQLGD